MKHLPLNADVECLNGQAGKSVDIVFNPVTRKAAYLVVEDKHAGHIKRLVPIDQIVKTSANTIQLDCKLNEFTGMEQFEITHFVASEMDYGPEDMYILEPYSLPAQYEVVEERIPPDQLAMRRGTAVKATDGKVGHVEEFLLDPNDGYITHFVVQGRHMLSKQELTLPVTAVDRIGEDIVYLKLSKKQLAGLPAVPTLRHGWKDAEVELIVLTFADVDKAGEALDNLKEWQKQGVIGAVRNAAVIVKNAEGKAKFHEKGDMDSRRGAIFGAITGGLIGLVGGPAGMVIGAAAGAATGGAAAKRIDVGLPDEYLRQIQEQLQPGTSALVAIVEHEWATSILEGLESLDGQVFKQMLTDEIVGQLTASG
ncbi:MAG: DUF1269 domain-containing protein [Chloroflexi bacterium]|nr:DUF1269 domain-containing protein [Chloroflexota bacterium]